MPENFQRTQKHKREVLRIEDLSAAELAAIAAAEVPAYARRFDHEFAQSTKEEGAS